MKILIIEDEQQLILSMIRYPKQEYQALNVFQDDLQRKHRFSKQAEEQRKMEDKRTDRIDTFDNQQGKIVNCQDHRRLPGRARRFPRKPDVSLYLGTINTNRYDLVDQILSEKTIDNGSEKSVKSTGMINASHHIKVH